MTTGVPASYPATRLSLHTVAEHVLAPALYHATGHIGLRPTPGGFGTPPFVVDGTVRQIRVDGVELVVADDATERRGPLTTVAQAAAFVGTGPGAVTAVYSPATPLDLDASLVVDPEAATIIRVWFERVGTALDRWRSEQPDGEQAVAQLWPEHFDLAITLDAVNYGGSPGDADHDEPYAYVGPWNVDHLGPECRNEPFGASRTHRELGSADDILAFFSAARAHLSRR